MVEVLGSGRYPPPTASGFCSDRLQRLNLEKSVLRLSTFLGCVL